MSFFAVIDIAEMLKYLLLGIIQGITEVLPISSSGHVELAKLLLHLQVDEGVLFLILVNSGSLVVFLVYFAQDLFRLIRSFFLFILRPQTRNEHRENFHFCLKIVVASIPAALVGLLLSDWFDEMLLRYGGLLSGIGLMFTATVLLTSGFRGFSRRNDIISYRDALFIGLCQGIAPVPGVSRSGMTMIGSLHRGVKLESSLRFAFMLYIPASAGAMLLYVKKMFSEGTGLPSSEYLLYYAVAFLAALLFTALAFRWIRPIFRNGRLKYFGYYCMAAGLVSIALFLMK
ncbi:MAG TPA: undecaprenyl-diphosphate phosphatase [Candidatus Izemoplasmatales bacterium]|nr:undecaprenyl-diphosphate phosphatase [Bacillota bacterium]HRY77153.1 undecaprenyl-diphosphate phosphatase [Candidatus Izemoplasmatales bacterium]